MGNFHESIKTQIIKGDEIKMKIDKLAALIFIIICVILISDSTFAKEQSWEDFNPDKPTEISNQCN